jgi:DNA-directed RNA polymerase subunit K/omega
MVNYTKLTQFEKVKIIGQRAIQISLGAPSTIDTELSDSIEIAEQEFNERKIPLMIKREYPNHKPVIIKLYK